MSDLPHGVGDDPGADATTPEGRSPTRVVHCDDAMAWLRARASLPGCSVITSLPDASELPGLSFAEWKRWFVDAAALAMDRCPPEGVAIFYQTDVQRDGTWVDKGYLCSRAAEIAGCETLWHRIACRRPPGSPSGRLHAYAHLLCFSRGVRHPPSADPSPDVLPSAGDVPWTRGMGLRACADAVRYVVKATPTRTVVDPFCGRGTVLAVANALGLDAVGVEIHRRTARRAHAARVALGPDGEPRLAQTQTRDQYPGPPP